jgi:hypothetical protein
MRLHTLDGAHPASLIKEEPMARSPNWFPKLAPLAAVWQDKREMTMRWPMTASGRKGVVQPRTPVIAARLGLHDVKAKVFGLWMGLSQWGRKTPERTHPGGKPIDQLTIIASLSSSSLFLSITLSSTVFPFSIHPTSRRRVPSLTLSSSMKRGLSIRLCTLIVQSRKFPVSFAT